MVFIYSWFERGGHTRDFWERGLPCTVNGFLPFGQLKKVGRYTKAKKLLEQYLGSKAIGEPSWVDIFKTLSGLVPPGLVLHSLGVRKDKEDWFIVLKGEVVATDGYIAQVAFNRFYRGLKSSLHMEEIELLPLDISIVKVAPVGVSANLQGEGVKIKKTRVQFEVRGQVKGI